MNCAGCQNPDAQDIFGGTEITVDDIISEMKRNPLTDGLTLSGGEPFQQAADCVRLAAAARETGLNVWTFSGFTFEELALQAGNEPDVKKLLELTDVLIDGRFVLAERTLSTKWRGSLNQRVLDVPKSLAAGSAVELEEM